MDNLQKTSLLLVLSITVLCFILTSARAAELEDIVNSARKRAESMKNNIVIKPDEKIMDEALKRARESYQEFQKRKDILLNNNTNQPEKKDEKITLNGDLYLFISSSIPVNTLRKYAMDAEKAKVIPMVMRGFVNGMKRIKPTVNFVFSILKKDPDCDFSNQQCDVRTVEIQINPLLFRKYGIEKVPALVYDTGDDFFVAYGDASLEYLVEVIQRETKDKSLDEVIEKIHGQY